MDGSAASGLDRWAAKTMKLGMPLLLLVFISQSVHGSLSITDLDPKLQNDPEYLKQFNCVPDNYVIIHQFNAGLYEDVLITADKLQITQGSDDYVLNLRAEALFKLGRFTEALDNYESLRNDPNIQEICRNYYEFGTDLGEYSLAAYHFNYARYLSAAGKTDLASQQLQLARKEIDKNCELRGFDDIQCEQEYSRVKSFFFTDSK